jgi:hypothetical protein
LHSVCVRVHVCELLCSGCVCNLCCPCCRNPGTGLTKGNPLNGGSNQVREGDPGAGVTSPPVTSLCHALRVAFAPPPTASTPALHSPALFHAPPLPLPLPLLGVEQPFKDGKGSTWEVRTVLHGTVCCTALCVARHCVLRGTVCCAALCAVRQCVARQCAVRQCALCLCSWLPWCRCTGVNVGGCRVVSRVACVSLASGGHPAASLLGSCRW